ncbi:MAG: hypothetical protein JXX29_06170 [Deltaproteobacteria bacterium]|nr:hypothetical protein [Deltaproteobacteria bacterium]MBN2671236.1 hypothetical protein [Deltaproteobacteria bacterium]
MIYLVVLLCFAMPLRALANAEDFEVCSVQEPYGDPLPMTALDDYAELFVPSDEQVTLITRLARGIHEWKTRREHGWWECGQYTPTGPETEDKAILLAYHLVKAAERFSDDGVQINVWGLAATIAHESSFDRCAVGYHFRKWAINKKLLKPRKRSISYGERELLDAMNSRRAQWWFETTGVDVGYCQLLTRFYDGTRREMMDSVKGLEICAEQFKYRSERLKTERPWKWWRGYKATWYDDRVTRRAIVLGARDDEI